MKDDVKKIKVSFSLNEKKVSLETYPMARLIDVLREDAGLTGTKEGCGEGECGACSVLLNGEIVNSCLIPVAQAEGAEIVTIEGRADDKTIVKVKDAFLKYGGTQCGFCTPGMVLSATNLLQKTPHPSLDEIKTGLAGNICRCTGYMKIFESVVRACEK